MPEFREYSLESLRTATKGFSADLIVSESGEKAPNSVYRGKLDQNRIIAVKRFPKTAWPDAKGFSVIICPFNLLITRLIFVSFSFEVLVLFRTSWHELREL